LRGVMWGKEGGKGGGKWGVIRCLGGMEIKGIGVTGVVGTLVLGGQVCKGVNSVGSAPWAGNYAGGAPHTYIG